MANEKELKEELKEEQTSMEQETIERPSEEVQESEENWQEKYEAEKDKNLRLFAEFENFKRRTTKERIDLFKTANQEVISALLPVLDDFERGLVEIEKNEDDATLKGVELIYQKMVDILTHKGLEKMKTKIGDDFNTDLHEAITQIPAPDEMLKGKIVDVIEQGYLLKEKIIRYSKVVIGQ